MHLSVACMNLKYNHFDFDTYVFGLVQDATSPSCGATGTAACLIKSVY